MTSNPHYVTDGATTLLGGVDEGREPLLLRADQVSRAINVTFRGGFPRTRPAFDKKGLTFGRGEYGMWFYFNFMQGAAVFRDAQGDGKLVCSVGGRIFLIEPANGFMMTDITPRRFTSTTVIMTLNSSVIAVPLDVADAALITPGYPIYINGDELFVASKSGNTLMVQPVQAPPGTSYSVGATIEYLDPNSPNQPLAWFEQAEQFMVIQDDQSRPIIFDGSGTRRAKIGSEIPTGSAMAYGRGRLWVAVNNGREFAAGDIAGGPTGVLGFLENSFLAGGGAFKVGANVGRIRAMKFVMNLDTSLGQGPLQVLCDRAIYSVNAPTSREAWATVTDPIQTESLINFGAKSQNSAVLVNGDLFFRAEDGFRSFFIARRDFGTWGNTPISMEMSRILDHDSPTLLIHSTAVVFDNRLLMTCSPTPTLNGVKHGGIVALDFDLISTLQGKSPPAYDGFWTGINPTVMLTGEFAGISRCFAFTIGQRVDVPASSPPELDGPQFYSGQNQLFEILKQGEEYARLDNGCRPIDCRIEYRSMFFPRKDGPTGLKRLHGAELWVSEFSGEVDFTLTYKPDQYPCWQDWATKTICITADQCDETDACDSTTTASNMLGFKTRIGFGVPPDSGDSADEKAMRGGYSFQVALEWSGYAALNRLTLYAHEQEEWGMAPPSDNRSVCAAIQCCLPDPFGYKSLFGTPDAPLIMAGYLGAGAASLYYFTDGSGDDALSIRDSVGTTFFGNFSEGAGIQKFVMPNPPSSYTVSASVTLSSDPDGNCVEKTSPENTAIINIG